MLQAASPPPRTAARARHTGKKREPGNGSLKDEGNSQSGRFEQETSKKKECDHIGRYYRPGGSFVKV
jgi:hypothetical protein